MDLLIQDNTDLFDKVNALFDEEMPCENANHDDDPNHEGPGQWYLASKTCGNCGNNRGVRLVCDSFAQYLLDGGPIACGRCKGLLGCGVGAYRSITRK